MEKNSKWNVEVSYPNFNEAVRMLKKFAGKKSTSKGGNTYVYITLKKTGLLIMALESSAACKAPAGYVLSAFRASGVDGTETVAVPLAVLIATAKKIKKSAYGQVSLLFEAGTVTVKLEDNLFSSGDAEVGKLGDVSKLFPSLSGDDSLLDFEKYDPVGEGSAGSFSHAMEISLMGTETDKNKIAQRSYYRKVILSLGRDGMTAVGTNGAKMAVSEIHSGLASYKLLGKPSEVTVEAEVAKVLADAIRTGSQGMFTLSAKDSMLGIIIKTSSVMDGYAFLITKKETEEIPNWRRVIPSDLVTGRTTVRADAASLLAGIDGIKDIAVKTGAKFCYIDIKDKKVLLAAAYQGHSVVAQAVPADITGADVRLGMNIKYLQDSILSLLDSQGLISMSIKSPLDSVVFFNDTDKFLIMPVDIRKASEEAGSSVSTVKVTVKQ